VSEAATLPIRRVTLFEDRAELLRRAEVTVAAGPGTLRVYGVTPLTSEAHLAARFEGAGARVESVRVDRRRVEGTNLRLERLSEERDAATRATDSAKRVVDQRRQRRDAAEALLARYLEAVGGAVWGGHDGHRGWREAIAALEEAADEASARIDEANAAVWACHETEQRLGALLGAEEDYESRVVCDLTLRVHAAEAGPRTLVLTSVVPCALWRPSHAAELLEDGRVRWSTHATVWQATGEDWNGVELRLSTDRPGAGAALPPVREDRLRLREKQARKRVVLEHREEAVSRDRGEAVVGGVYDGGCVRVFRVEGEVDVPSDGRPHRVATGGFESEASSGLVAMPEVAKQVFLRARLHNRGAQPLLAGPVTLLRDGAYVGRGEVRYVGPGEPFELSFGSDDRFSLHHERRREVEKRMVGRDRVHFITDARVVSTAPSRASVEVLLRLPVSELEALDVRLSDKLCSEGRPEPDADGLVRVTAELAPGEARTISLGFHLDRSGDVVLPDPW